MSMCLSLIKLIPQFSIIQLGLAGGDRLKTNYERTSCKYRPDQYHSWSISKNSPNIND